jgi:Arc/MetJ family transcription regulator
LQTNIEIDDDLIDQALRIGRHKTKTEAVTAALKEYVQRRRHRRVLDLVGQIEYEPDYEYKELRRSGRSS